MANLHFQLSWYNQINLIGGGVSCTDLKTGKNQGKHLNDSETMLRLEIIKMEHQCRFENLAESFLSRSTRERKQS